MFTVAYVRDAERLNDFIIKNVANKTKRPKDCSSKTSFKKVQNVLPTIKTLELLTKLGCDDNFFMKKG